MPRKKKPSPKPKIERQEVIAETGRRSYEMLRLTRVKYEKNPYTFVDVRLFQRGYNDSGDESYYPTKKGVQLKEKQFQRLIGKWTLVPSLLFHPLILKKAYPSLGREEFDTAVFHAFKTVEVRVREMSGLPSDLVGTALMRKAFDVDSGPLTDGSAPRAEREARSHLFAGAIGSYKNPHSHREVQLTFNEAFEMLLIASHLLQILDRV
ncbi:MAG: TIGR02391 family protein [Phycisphaerae bacterium]